MHSTMLVLLKKKGWKPSNKLQVLQDLSWTSQVTNKGLLSKLLLLYTWIPEVFQLSVVYMFSIFGSMNTFWSARRKYSCSILCLSRSSERDIEKEEGGAQRERDGVKDRGKEAVGFLQGLWDPSPDMAWICKGESITSLLATHTRAHWHAQTYTHTYTDKRRVETLLLNITAGAEWNMTKKGNMQ